MTVGEYIAKLKNNPMFMRNVTSWRVRARARGDATAHFRPSLDAARGRCAARAGASSGRTFTSARRWRRRSRGGTSSWSRRRRRARRSATTCRCSTRFCKNESARALYLFPTKALASDQASELYAMIEAMGADVKAYTYDGDTPGLGAHGDPAGRPRRGDQPGHAASGHPAAPREVGEAV